ncbi:MAG: hypothetical protein HY537_16385 [Deltaproteobacteria bacterium]|nr:hypothetical protein [Deltaproteobacteria bacterium]
MKRQETIGQVGKLRVGLWCYGLIQLAQWVSYACIFKILLEGSGHAGMLAPVYVGALALVRAVASALFGKKWLIENRYAFTFILFATVAVTGLQELFIYLGKKEVFLALTAIKLGALVVFQVWRDVISSKLSRLGIAKAHRINSQFGIIEFGTMAVGVFAGGVLTTLIGPAQVIWCDVLILGIAAFLQTRSRGVLSRPYLGKNYKGTGFRPIGLLGHGVRSLSDAGFQSILPILGYQVIKMSAAVFGLAISVSGILIALGAKLAVYFSNTSQTGRARYATICLVTTVINAIGLGLCFQAEGSAGFIIWLGLASLAAGIAMVTTRTIVLAEVQTLGDSQRDGAYYFNTIRWAGLGMGALSLAWLLYFFDIQTLGLLYLLCMVISGILLWFAAYEGASRPSYIGRRIQEILAGTFILLFVVGACISYFVLQTVPRQQRIQARAASLVSYIALVELNLRVSDLSEVLRLAHSFSYPAGIVSSRIVGADGQVLVDEAFDENGNNLQDFGATRKNLNFEKLSVESDASAVHIFRARLGFLSHLYQYKYVLKASGPGGNDVHVLVTFDDTKQAREDFFLDVGVGFLVLLFFGILFVALRSMAIQLLKPLAEVANRLQDGLSRKEPSDLAEVPECAAGTSLEVQRVVRGYNAVLERNRALYSQLLRVETNQKLSEMATKLAHDIRSPLTALDMAMKTLPRLPEDTRFLIRGSINRIRDIANSLLEKHRETAVAARTRTIELLPSILLTVVNEKRMQFSQTSKANMVTEFADDSWDLFCELEPVEFKRVLSNIINNSFDAITSNGRIVVALERNNDKTAISISDTGRGIPPEILQKIGEKGVTHGKPTGNGLGLYHAFRAIASWNGNIEIKSTVGEGTTLTLHLPIVPPPEWFASSLKLLENQNIVILDDDTTIHKVWDSRFAESIPQRQLKIHHFSSTKEMKAWIRKRAGQNQKNIFLVDYELLGEDESGLDLIESSGIASESILVTGRFDESRIQERCRKLSVAIMPKAIVPFVNIQLVESEISNEPLPC